MASRYGAISPTYDCIRTGQSWIKQ